MRKAEFAQRILERLVPLIIEYARKDEAPASRPSPPEPEPRKLRQSERPGISMNDLARTVPKPRPPRAPDMQQRRFNGLWHFWD